MPYHTIEIDWDIHRAIVNEQRGFDEPPHKALRRLLGLPDLDEAETSEMKIPLNDHGIPWRDDGVEIPSGTKARMKYNYGRQIYEGHFSDGKLVVNGEEFDTLSRAASSLAVTKDGKKTQLDGWRYWEALLPGEKHWRSLKDMRADARKKIKNVRVNL
ncbi:hypothetical protein [Erythrobacter donghaensis]|jgi:hypothetical protein|uniref:hypothetical protein n=1 Tax=Erythrobacter donghaensis TaxID=267135 RepID=UPI000AF0ECB2|nr:hypothetical protein [Erythrobacter donghaensis]